MTEVIINDRAYPISTSLRVAFKIQGMHNHAPYAKVFATVADMPIEDQIGIVYAGFSVANPEDAKTITLQKFIDHCLDTYDLSVVMGMINDIIKGIMGKLIEEDKETGGFKPTMLGDDSGNM